MATYRLKSRYFTKYDQTDNLKRMKDSDILAEKPKETSDVSGAIRSGAGGALTLGTLGAGLGAITGGYGARHSVTTSIASGAKGGAKALGATGALLGAGVGLTYNYLKNKNKFKDNQFYNNRLQYAQKYARRREQKDWNTNMTQRDGYSY